MSCRICKEKTILSFNSKGWPLVKCVNCGFLQVDRKPNEAELIEIYSKNYFTHNKYADISTLYKEYTRRLNLVKKYIPEKAEILDFGCAAADFIKFAEKQYNFTGFDYSKAAIIKAIEDNPDYKGKLFYGDYHELQQVPQQFNAIMLWDVIEHIWDPVEIMTFLSKLIQSKGFVFISTPDIDSFFSKLTGKYWPFMTPPEHLSFFGTRSFKKLVEKTGFKIIYNSSKGKWANVGFIFYKLKRIFPKLVPQAFINFFNKKYTSKLAVYVPTFDVKYVVLQKLD